MDDFGTFDVLLGFRFGPLFTRIGIASPSFKQLAENYFIAKSNFSMLHVSISFTKTVEANAFSSSKFDSV